MDFFKKNKKQTLKTVFFITFIHLPSTAVVIHISFAKFLIFRFFSGFDFQFWFWFFRQLNSNVI